MRDMWHKSTMHKRYDFYQAEEASANRKSIMKWQYTKNYRYRRENEGKYMRNYFKTQNMYNKIKLTFKANIKVRLQIRSLCQNCSLINLKNMSNLSELANPSLSFLSLHRFMPGKKEDYSRIILKIEYRKFMLFLWE